MVLPYTANKPRCCQRIRRVRDGPRKSIYNDIRSKGEEFSREPYLKADLNVAPKPKLTDRQIIEAFIRGRGLDPRAILREEAQNEGFGEPHRIETGEKEQ